VTSTAFLLFFGPGGESAVEAQLDRIRIAIGSGTLRRAAAAGFAPRSATPARRPSLPAPSHSTSARSSSGS
jgi:hypothetical protein